MRINVVLAINDVHTNDYFVYALRSILNTNYR